MNLPKAIELNQEAERDLRTHDFHDHADAINLGIEALKRIAEQRKQIPPWTGIPLPGETEGD